MLPGGRKRYHAFATTTDTMPTIHRQEGFAFRIYTHDHEPAHVHAIHADGVAVILLGDDGTYPGVREVRGEIRDPDVVQPVRIVAEHQAMMIAEWRRIHG